MAKGAKAVQESVIDFWRPESISVRETRLKVEYWSNITKEILVLLVKTTGISYMISSSFALRKMAEIYR